MSDENEDPSANTQAFRAFANQSQPAEASRTNMIMFVSIAVAALLAVVVAVVLLL